MRRLAVLLSVLVALALAPAAVAETFVDEQWTFTSPDPTGTQPGEWFGMTIQDAFSITVYPSYLIGVTENGGVVNVDFCENAASSACTSATYLNYLAFLPPCSATVTMDCIVGLSAIKPDGTTITGALSESFPVQGLRDFRGGGAIPTGATPSIWTIGGMPNGGGSAQYMVIARLIGSSKAGNAHTGPFNPELTVQVQPVLVTNGADFGLDRPYLDDDVIKGSCSRGRCAPGVYGGSKRSTGECAFTDVGRCALREAFPTDVKFRLELRLKDSPRGWFHGRVSEQEIELTKETDGYRFVAVAAPVRTPVVSVWEKFDALPPAIQATYSPNSGRSTGEIGPSGRRNRMNMLSPESTSSFDAFALWLPYFKDSSDVAPSLWTLRSMTVPNDAASCFRDTSKFLGVVSTNATVYAPGPPAFTAATSSLDYRVAAPHLVKTELFKGTYDLQMRSEVARCVYGFSSAPVSATVSVVSAGGENIVATSAVSEKDGWLRFRAAGFTFSSPTVRVQLTQPKSKVATPVASATTQTGKVKQQVRITCTKGKLVRVVAGKCPTGWKRK